MKARPADWLTFVLTIVGSMIALVGVAFVLNFTGDCAPEVTNCGVPQIRATYVVLGLGAAWLVYLVIRFIRSPRTFR